MVMRQDNRAREKLFVDYAGQKVPIIDRTSDEIKEVEIFVALMGTSNYTFAEANWSKSLPFQLERVSNSTKAGKNLIISGNRISKHHFYEATLEFG